MCPTFHCNLTVRFIFNCHIQSNAKVTVKITVNQLYNYSSVLGAAIEYKLYSDITVESGTHLKTVKITSNYYYCSGRNLRGVRPSKTQNLFILS